ncbi:hypothetical protein [Pararcticibacter amylolyticus]|uniref:Uncharacterized protein n=1 Tax=Pararcticibacter amylolyticus TaxID=2173175 RepID=A0A2U2P9M1_9SPHI|nr:hypothetical protein [Pararcticibacter amylolyticus]PWG77994.1 hypothetical protein DDR33_24585 [Pararcticibacter amylolyticus]
MKRLLIALTALITAFDTLAQNSFPPNGNVGIGTTNPTTGLQLGDWGNAITGKQILIPGLYNFEQFRLGQIANGNMVVELVYHTNLFASYKVSA